MPRGTGPVTGRRLELPGLTALSLVALAVLAGACKSPDPKAEMELSDLETYWAVDPSTAKTSYIAPVVRFNLKNRGGKPQRSVQATAVFRRKGEETLTWGSAWQQVAGAKKPLPVGVSSPVVLKSDARYTSPGEPTQMFEHELFKDAQVEVFVRVGSSGWVKFGQADVERRIGARSVQAFR